jgi:hypothetical protein
MLLRRFLFLTLAAAFLVFGLGAFEARAASVTLPVALDPGLTTTVLALPQLIIAQSNGNTTTVSGAENLTFSNFNYTSSATGAASAYPATSVGVLKFVSGVETGIQFNAGWSVTSSNSGLDLAITYTVTAPKGQLITDAYLSVDGTATGTGSATVSENLFNGLNSIGTLNASVSGPTTDLVFFPQGYQSITLVEKDIDLTVNAGGTAQISFVDQGFSSTAVPEPTSMALLGIGMAGFFTYRRLFKRAAAV